MTGSFRRAGGTLQCEAVPLEEIAATVGTPFYVYAAGTIRDRYRQLDAALSGVPHRLHYTLKANANAAILRELRDLGAGVDIVSGGELHRALRAGFRGEDIIFGGVGKTEQELREGLEADVLFFNVESEAELILLDRIAAEMGRTARVSLRVNPEITVEAAHEYIKTGQKGAKFGIPYDEVLPAARVARDLPNTELVGLDMHLGSQLSTLDPYLAGTERLVLLCLALRQEGVDTLRWLDIGGGLAVRYDDEALPDLGHFSELLVPGVAQTGLQLIMEPGRFMVGNAGMLVTRVLYRKRSGGKEHLVCDAGMTELLRPSHYGAYHRIEAVRRRAESMVADVVGPVCESGDFLALDRELDAVCPGDLLGVFDAGAYGYVMSSNYNARPRAAEVFVDGDRWALVTARERYDDLVRHELPDPVWHGRER
ncbi:MAG TPA: diaminopimelate decarboxylase [Gemmatimonadaceae bacterium]|nr:diaminopimelate decarboxylase [Gemmatimonadaceae bacterium]